MAVGISVWACAGADVERSVRDALRNARRAGRALSAQDLLDAVRDNAPAWPADVRRHVAYHEAGDAVAMLALRVAAPVALSIGGTGDLAKSKPGEIRAQTRRDLEPHLIALLAGRA